MNEHHVISGAMATTGVWRCLGIRSALLHRQPDYAFEMTDARKLQPSWREASRQTRRPQARKFSALHPKDGTVDVARPLRE